MKRFINLFKADFVADGSNERKFQNEEYSKFVKYAREAAGKSLLENLSDIRKKKHINDLNIKILFSPALVYNELNLLI